MMRDVMIIVSLTVLYWVNQDLSTNAQVNYELDSEASYYPPMSRWRQVNIMSDLHVNHKVREILQQCSMIVTSFLQYTDDTGYNADWLFYVLTATDDRWYKAKIMSAVDATIVDGRFPSNYPAMGKSYRQASIYDLCQWVADVHAKSALSYDQYSLRPYTLEGFIYMMNLERLLKNYNVIPSRYHREVDFCVLHFNKLERFFRKKHVPYQEFIRNLFGVNPYFSNEKWCTIGTNHVLRRLVDTRRQYRAAMKLQGTERQKMLMSMYNFHSVHLEWPLDVQRMLSSDNTTQELLDILTEQNLILY